MPGQDHSSPRTRGYFQMEVTYEPVTRLFPAHAGVFPIHRLSCDMRIALPRARGGISWDDDGVADHIGSSPRTRGYFR